MATAPLPIRVESSRPSMEGRQSLADAATVAKEQRERALRQLCLEYAAKAASERQETDADTIIRDAGKFYDFLAGNPLREPT